LIAVLKWTAVLAFIALVGAAVYLGIGVVQGWWPDLASSLGLRDSYDRGVGKPLGCAPGEDYDAGLCYTKCPDGFRGIGPDCRKLCPEGYRDDPLHCGKDSYGRGVGGPLTCAPDEEYDSGLCYTKCPDGFRGAGPGCWGLCPEGYRDDGAFCAKPSPYGRGAGYPWKVGDRPFSLDDARRRCEQENAQGCEEDGAIIYPKCRSGFHAVGCCTCSPDCPPGMRDIGVSCHKPTHDRGVGRPIHACPAGKEEDAGLCYDPCREGYRGAGPVCWQTCPDGFRDIGVSCEKPGVSRGVGKPVHACAPGQERDAGLCYDPCKEGYRGVGPRCWQS
jgi:hypothetical protein